MKIKKLLSTFAALAIAASSFAGLGITANAAEETEVLNATFEADTTYAEGFTFTSTARFASSVETGTGDNTTKVQFMTGSGSTNGYGVYCPISENADISVVDYSFDVNMSGRVSTISLGSGGSRATTTGGRALTLAHHTAGSASIITGSDATAITSGGEVYGTSDTWYHVEASLNNVTKKSNVNIYEYLSTGDYSEAEPVYTATNKDYMDITCNATGFDFFAPNVVGSYIDNLVITQTVLSMPTITLTGDMPETLNPEISTELTVATTKGAETDTLADVTVTSSDNNIATASINGNTITVTAVAEGDATITATVATTGNNSHAAETASATYDVKVVAAGMTEQDVTVNYYVTETTNAVPNKATSITGKYAGDTVESTEVDLETVADATGRYTFNETASTALPYTVVDGENVINLYFDKADPVASYTVNYTGIEKEATTVSLTNTYVGDTYTYYTTKYVKDDENNWATADEVRSYSGTLTADTSIEVAYTYTEDDIVAFVEGETLTATAYTGDALSGGSSGRRLENAPTAATITESGIYKIVFVNTVTRADRAVDFSVYKNDASNAENVIGSVTKTAGEVAAGATVETVVEDVVLNNGDMILASSTVWECCLDYMVITKTGDLPSISSVVTAAPAGVTVTAPATVTDADDEETTATYAELTEGKVVTTVYVKVDNATDGVAPVVTFNEFEDPAQATVKTTVNSNGYFIYQIVADAAVTVKSVTYTNAADYVPVV